MKLPVGHTPEAGNALSFKRYKEMRTFTCIGYVGYICGQIVKQTSNNHKRCPSCAKINRDSVVKKIRQQLSDKGMCRSHSKTPVALGKKKCQNCLDTIKNNRLYLLSKGVCPYHTDSLLVPGKVVCQFCLDGQAIYKLPEKAQSAAWVRANETREARINGTYVCPIFKKAAFELNELYLCRPNQSVWEFDHVGDIFRDIISGRANHAIGTLTSEQLFQGAEYARKHEI